MKFASFDVEIVNDFPEDGSWSKELGISCAAIAYTGKEEVDFYHAPSGLSSRDAKTLVVDLALAEQRGYKIVTWNGAKFDFRVLADVSGMYSSCAELAMNHLDMMLWVTFQKGYYLGLEAALKGAGVKGKLKEVALKDGTILTDMSGAKAPELWKAGEYDAVLEYLKDDVLQPLELAHKIDDQKRLHWRSKSGKPQMVNVPTLWTVKECFDLPKPNVSWMTNPPKREDFIDWMKE